MKKRKKLFFYFISFFVFLIFLLSSCGKNKNQETESTDSNKSSINNSEYLKSKLTPNFNIAVHNTHYHTNSEYQKQQLLFHFVKSKLIINSSFSNSYNIQYLLNSNEKSLICNKMFNKFSGYYLLYLALSKKKNKFNNFYNATKNLYYIDNQFCSSYLISNNKKSNVIYSSDNLEIIEALLIYDQKFHTNFYTNDINKLYSQIKKNLLLDRKLYESYNIENKKHTNFINLSSFNLITLKSLEFNNNNKSDKEEYLSQLNIIKNGYISNKFPLYKSKYNYDTGEYSNENISCENSLLIMQRLSEVGELPNSSLQWLTRKVMKRQLYEYYTINGNPINHNQSIAGYAIAAIIASNQKDPELYQAAISQLLSFQVIKYNDYTLNGAFIDSDSQHLKAINNLLPLIALEY